MQRNEPLPRQLWMYLDNVFIGIFYVGADPFRDEDIIVVKSQGGHEVDQVELFLIPCGVDNGPTSERFQQLQQRFATSAL